MKGKQLQFREPKIKTAKAEVPLSHTSKISARSRTPFLTGTSRQKAPRWMFPHSSAVGILPSTPHTHQQFPSPGRAQEGHRDYPKLARKLPNTPSVQGTERCPVLAPACPGDICSGGVCSGSAAPSRAGALWLPDTIPAMTVVALGYNGSLQPTLASGKPMSHQLHSARAVFPLLRIGLEFPAAARLPPARPQALLPLQRCWADGHDSFGFSTRSAFLPACSEPPQTRTDSNSPLKHNYKRGNRKRREKGPGAKLKPTVKRGWFCQDAKTVATAESLFSPHQPLGSAARPC